jgi:hypothetical protein
LSKPEEPSEEPGNDPLPDPMRLWERWMAGLFGSGFGVAGTFAVFKTSNQVGSSVLLVVCAALLLIAIQGTPLVKLGGDKASIEMAKRARRVQEAIERARSESNPDVAHGILEAAEIIEPQFTQNPATQGLLYQERVTSAITKLFENVTPEPADGRYEISVTTPMGETVVEVKYKRFGSFTPNDVSDVIRQAPEHVGKLLIVTNAPLTESVRSINGAEKFKGTAVEVVTWNDEVHNDLLQRAIARNAY